MADASIPVPAHGLNYLTSVVTSDGDSGTTDFAGIQANQIDAYLAHHPDPASARVSHELVVIPTDTATRDQVRRYKAYAESRSARTRSPQGPGGLVFAPDLVGPSDEIAAQLYAHAGFQRAGEVAFALPFFLGLMTTSRSSPTWQPGLGQSWDGRPASEQPV